MKTLYLLLARYDGKPFIPIDNVLEDFFLRYVKEGVPA